MGQIVLGAPTMGGNQHASQGIDIGRNPITLVVGAECVAKRLDITASGQSRQRTALLDGVMYLLLGLFRTGKATLAPLPRVARIQFVHQAIQAVEVVAHGQGRHTIGMALQQLARLDRAAVADNRLMIQPFAAAPEASQQQQQQGHSRPARAVPGARSSQARYGVRQ